MDDPEYIDEEQEDFLRLLYGTMKALKVVYYDEKLDIQWVRLPASAASTNPLQYDSYFIWEVGRDYWKNNPDMKMRLEYTVVDGTISPFR